MSARFERYGETISRARKAAGLTQEEAAAAIGLTKDAVSRFERGVNGPTLSTLAKLATAYGCEAGDLLPTSGGLPPAYKPLIDALEATPAEARSRLIEFATWTAAHVQKTPLVIARAEPNASAIRITLADESDDRGSGSAQPRRATVAQFDPARLKRRGRAAANPGGGAVTDDHEADLPEREIPAHYWQLGARRVYKAEGDSMVGVGITDRDLLFVRPARDVRAAAGQIVVCRVAGAVYVKILDLSDGGIRLLSANERYAPLTVDEEADHFELAGVVIGRSGYPPAMSIAGGAVLSIASHGDDEEREFREVFRALPPGDKKRALLFIRQFAKAEQITSRKTRARQGGQIKQRDEGSDRRDRGPTRDDHQGGTELPPLRDDSTRR